MPSENPKVSLRKEAAELRAALKNRRELSHLIAERFLESIPIPEDAVVSAYFAIGDEADPSALIAELRKRGRRIAMPRVAGRDVPLDFHLWQPGVALIPGGFGLSEPSRDWPKVAPDILVVPMLAFDEAGYRIGYGAGYYDRTLSQLRRAKMITAAGFAFATQEFPTVAHMPHDERLDWIVTEMGARKIT